MEIRPSLLHALRLSRLIFPLAFIASLAYLTPVSQAQTAHFSGAIEIHGRAPLDLSRNVLSPDAAASPNAIQTTHGDFGNVNVGASSANPVAMVFTFDAAVTLGSTAVVTQGAPNLDFTDTGTGTCKANKAYNAGNTCSVNVTFKPRAPGVRYGAAELLDTSGNLLATAYVQGIGVSPQATFANTTTGVYLPSAQSAVGSGFGGPLGSGFGGPFGLAADASGNVFVADGNGNAVKEILAVGGYTTIKTLGSGLVSPMAVAVDGAGNVFVAESQKPVVKEILAAGGYTTVKTLGSGFSSPCGVTVDGSGNLFVADWNNSAVYEILAADGYTTIKNLVPGSFSCADDVAVDGSANVFVADFCHGAVKEIPAAGGYTTVKTLHSGFNGPSSLALDASGNVFVTDEYNSAVREILAAGGYTTVNTVGSGFTKPTGLARDGRGNVFVADSYLRTITKLHYADPPSLSFPALNVGSQGQQQVTVSNNGNADLAFPVPASGDNPMLDGTGFTLDAGTTCPQIAAASAAGKLASGASCVYTVDFNPTADDTYSGSLTLTDNTLNASPAVTQTISMTGTVNPIPTQLVFTTPPQSTLEAGGTPSPVKVSLENAQGNVATTYSSTVTLAVTGPNSYSKTYTSAAASGVATFNGLSVINGAGTYTYAATDAADSLTPVTATQQVTPAQKSYAAPSTNVGATSASQTATLIFEASGTLNAIDVLTQGAVNLDFKLASGGTCAIGTAYSAQQTCTVNYIFDPLHPGLRLGAIRLSDASGKVLATANIFGTGVGPLVTFGVPNTSGYYQPSSQSNVGSGFNGPNGVTVDASGNIFVADGANNSVKEILAVNGVIPVSPTIRVLATGFWWPYGIAVDGSGNVFVGDRGHSAVREIMAVNGVIPDSPTIRSLGGGFHFSGPNGLSLDGSGNVFVADWNNSAVYEILAAGDYTTVKNLASGSFSGADYTAVDGNGNVFVADFSGVVKELPAAGGYTTVKILGSGLGSTSCVAVDASGNLFVTDWGGGVVKEVLAAGGYTTVKTLAGGFDRPNSLTVDASGNVYVSDQGGSRLVKLNYADPPSLTFAKTTVGTKSSDSPQTVTVSNNGNADLTIPVPASGANPSITSKSFTLDAATSCPKLTSSSTAATLAAGASCNYAVDFIPQAGSSVTGSLKLTDNSLNASPAVAQTISLSGTTTGPHLAFTTPPPASLQLGQLPGAVAVSVEDSNNVLMTTSSATVTLTVTGPNSYSKVYTATASSGIATFSSLPSLSNLGTYTYTATDVPDGMIQATVTESVWKPHLAFTTPPPAALQQGKLPGTVALSAEDPLNNVIAAFSGAVTLTVTGPGSYSQVYTTTASSGVATFSNLPSLTTLGVYTYTATDAPDGLTQAVAKETLWKPHLAFTAPPPANLSVDQVPGPIAVSVEDSSNNVITASSATVTLRVTGPNTYAKIYTATASSGVATFSALAALKTAGSYTYTATDGPDGFTQAAATQSVTWPPPFGKFGIAVDSVTFSTTVGQADSVKLQGWVADLKDGAPLSNVQMYIDGTAVGTPTLGIARPDVVAQYGSAYINSGFLMFYPASSLALGQHKATVIATNAAGQPTTLGPLTFTVAATAGLGFPLGGVDKAVDSVTLSTTVGQANSVWIVGWAADPQDGAPLSNVNVYIDGTLIGPPTLGISRSDIATNFGSAYLNSGFQLLYPASSLSLGTHQVTVTAIDSGGRSRTFGPHAFTVAATAGVGWPFGAVDAAVDSVTGTSPVSQSGSLLVAGWAADPQDGAPLTNVKVYVDGKLIGKPTLGIKRAAIAATYGSKYLNSGYRLVYPASSFSTGDHHVTVVAADSGGRATTLGPRTFTVQ